MCRKTAQFIQGLLADEGPQGGEAHVHPLLPAAEHGLVQLLLLGLQKLLRPESGTHLVDVARLPQHGGQKPLFGAGHPQCAPACAVGHLDLVHLALPQTGAAPLPAALAAGPFHGVGQLGHDGGLGDVGLLGQTACVDLLLGGVGALGQHLHGLLDVLEALGVLLEVVLVPQPLHPEVQRVAHAVQQGLEAIGTVFLDVLVRVLRPRDL